MIQAIFFDIDGTLVSFQTHTIPQSAMDALYLLKEKGIKLFIATGRAKDGLAVLKQFPFDGYITLNGQYCFTDHHIIYENTISSSQLEILVNSIHEHPFPCGFVRENDKIFNYRDERVDYIHSITLNDDHPAGDISNITHEKVYQCMAFINEEEEKELLSRMPGCIAARWHPSFCDISPKGGTKQNGIDQFLNYYHLKLEDTMAIGDGGNDLAMLKHVHYPVAMGNGEDKLKEIAVYVTDTVENDGIYKAMKHFDLI